jgi:hypothetical protein
VSDLEVIGGSGGVGADTDDLRQTADQLAAASEATDGVAAVARDLAASSALLASTPFSPGTAARAQAELLEAAASTTKLALGIDAQVLVLRMRATMFEVAGGVQDAGADALQVAGVPLALQFLVNSGIAGFGEGAGAEAENLLGRILRGEVDVDELDDAMKAVLAAGGAGAGDQVQDGLTAFPWLTDTLTGGLPVWLSAGASAASRGRVRLPADFEGFTALLQGLAGAGGFLQDRPTRVRPLDGTTRAPSDLADTMAELRELVASTSGAEDGSSKVRVIRVDGEPPRWVVLVPGTQTFHPKAGADPSDMTTNVELVQGQGEILKAIRDAMAEAGVGMGDPVMVAGHSQGGIAAAALASDAETRERFNVTHVMTAGSPIARLPVPDDVTVVAFEHEQDPVPRLEGDPNPDRAGWTTVRKDLGSEAQSPGHAHEGDLYVETIREALGDDRLDDVGESFAPFMAGGSGQDFELVREPER